MSKWIDNEIDSFVKTKIDTIETKKNIIESEELDKIAPYAIAHFKEQMKKENVLEREFYPYQNGIITLIATFPPREWQTVKFVNKEKKVIREEKRPKNLFKKAEYSFQGFCKVLLREGSGICFLSEDDSKELSIKAEQKAWMYGTIATQYDIKGHEKKYYKSVEEACEKNSIDISKIDMNDIDISYKTNIFQIVAKVG